MTRIRRAEAACVCVFITAGPSTKPFAWGGGDMEDMCYERRRAEACVRLVCVFYYCRTLCVFITAVLLQSCSRGRGGGNGGHVLRETMSQGRC
jgi:hypothetical protein